MGMSHLSRNRARDTLDHFRAAAAAGGHGPERERWVDEQTHHAGW